MAAETRESSLSPHLEEVCTIQRDVTAKDQTIRRLENDLEKERQRYTMLENKVIAWKERVKRSTIEDRLRIARLEEELKSTKGRCEKPTEVPLRGHRDANEAQGDMGWDGSQERVRGPVTPPKECGGGAGFLMGGHRPVEECPGGVVSSAVLEVMDSLQSACCLRGSSHQQTIPTEGSQKDSEGVRTCVALLRPKPSGVFCPLEVAPGRCRELDKSLDEGEVELGDCVSYPREDFSLPRPELEAAVVGLEAGTNGKGAPLNRCGDIEGLCEDLPPERDVSPHGQSEVANATNVRDESIAGELKVLLCASRSRLRQVCSATLMLLGYELEKPLEVIVDEFDETLVDVQLFSQRLNSFREFLVRRSKPYCVASSAVSILQMFELICSTIDAVRNDYRELTVKLEKCNQMLIDAESRLAHSEAKCSALISSDIVEGLESKNLQLEEKCELLRKEIKRQREAFQWEKSQWELTTANARWKGGLVTATPSDGVFERGMLTLAAQQSQRENEMRQLRTQLQTLERENAVLKRECEHNNSVLIQYTKEMGVLKTKERVQQSVEYVRNVVLQYLCCPQEEMRTKMIPAIAAVLEFTAKEKQDVRNANPSCPKFQ